MSVSFGSIQTLLPAYRKMFDQSNCSLDRKKPIASSPVWPTHDDLICRILWIYQILPQALVRPEVYIIQCKLQTN